MEFEDCKTATKGRYPCRSFIGRSESLHIRTEQFCGVSYSGHRHRTLNVSKGVIRCSELQNCDKEEMLAKLKAQQVKDIQNKNDFGS